MDHPDNSWFLEGFADDSDKLWRTSIQRQPFRVGRQPESDLVLRQGRVSLRHAELFFRQGGLWIRDCGSTNGTFVNSKRISTDVHLQEGDIVHFADQDFRVDRMASSAAVVMATRTMPLLGMDLPRRMATKTRELKEMLREGAHEAHFQPLIRLADGHIMGYEALGRGRLAGEPAPPGELFMIAEAIGLEVELSTAFRAQAVTLARDLPPSASLFLNVHPNEVRDVDRLLISVEALRRIEPDRSLVLEIHEAAVTDRPRLERLRSALTKLEVEIAFDDFGRGQARLMQLTEVAPRYVKFDAAWTQDLHRAVTRRRDMLETLLGMVNNLGIASLAEGVERPEEVEQVKAVGFQYAQGYHFGRPAPISEILKAS